MVARPKREHGVGNTCVGCRGDAEKKTITVSKKDVCVLKTSRGRQADEKLLNKCKGSKRDVRVSKTETDREVDPTLFNLFNCKLLHDLRTFNNLKLDGELPDNRLPTLFTVTKYDKIQEEYLKLQGKKVKYSKELNTLKRHMRNLSRGGEIVSRSLKTDLEILELQLELINKEEEILAKEKEFWDLNSV